MFSKTTRRRLGILIAALLTGAGSGCSSTANQQPRALSGSAMSASHAECLVCKKNADLACVDVDVDGKTPFADYAGKRYYFCSDECKAEFQKNPAKFAAAAK